MFNEQGKLIVIHQYPSPDMQHFLNPVCKGTFDALPKIYGKQAKKKYHRDHNPIREGLHIRCLRECCNRKYQDQRTKTVVKKKERARYDSFWSMNKDKQQQRRESKVRTKTMSHKGEKLILPNLKVFQSEELSESETNHKVCRPIGGATSLDVDSLKESREKYTKTATPKEPKLRKQSQFTNSNESVQTEEKYFEFASKNHQSFRERTKTQGDNAKSLRYYEYLQNEPKFKGDQGGELLRANTNLKASNRSDEDTFSLSSSAIRQRKDSTMFHKFKVRQTMDKSLKKSNKAYSVLSNGLFKIPEEEQFQDYISHYKPLNPEFDIKNLLKQPNFHIVPTDGKVFFGQVENKKRHGQGITVSEKQIYEGKYEEDYKTFGCEKNRDGTYRGEYLKGKRHGKGKFIWTNGQEFEGQWKNGKKNGFGIWKSPKGDYYEGQWIENRQNGQGYFFHIGGSEYRGQFRDFLKHGRGQEEFPNGDKYIGSYALGKPHGKGKYTWSNGDSYEGSFGEGSRSGEGVLKRKSGEIYEGEFKNDMKHGRGHERHKSGEDFEGEFREGERWKGTLRTSQGKIIELTE